MHNGVLGFYKVKNTKTKHNKKGLNEIEFPHSVQYTIYVANMKIGVFQSKCKTVCVYICVTVSPVYLFL